MNDAACCAFSNSEREKPIETHNRNRYRRNDHCLHMGVCLAWLRKSMGQNFKTIQNSVTFWFNNGNLLLSDICGDE